MIPYFLATFFVAGTVAQAVARERKRSRNRRSR